LGVKLRKQGSEFVGPCPVCGDGDKGVKADRFSIRPADGVFNCRKCGGGKAMHGSIDLLMWGKKMEFNTACEVLTREPRPNARRPTGNGRDPSPDGKPKGDGEPKWGPQDTWSWFEYRDADGVPLYLNVRIPLVDDDGRPIQSDKGKPDKTFRQVGVDATGHAFRDENQKIAWGLKRYGIEAIPYRLPELLTALEANRVEPDESTVIVIAEGERKADKIARLGLPATSIPRAKDAKFAEYFDGADVVIAVDNDDAGRKRAQWLCEQLYCRAKRIRLLAIPGLAEGEDVEDWIDRGGTLPRLLELAYSAKEWQPPPPSEPEKPPTVLPATKTAAQWVGRSFKDRRYIAPNFLPFREVSLLNGHGGTMKTQLAMQLAIAVLLGTDLIGFPILQKGPVIFYTIEEEDVEMCRRCPLILERLPNKPTLADLSDLHFICMSEEEEEEIDMSLASVHTTTRMLEKDGKKFSAQQREVHETRAYVELMERAKQIKPALVILENVTDLFPDTENECAVVYKFMSLARTIARQLNCAVLVLQHVSDTGRASGEQKSGSTGWHNKARYRFSLAKPKDEETGIEDDTKRTLVFHKHQYGDLPSKIPTTLENDRGYLKLPAGTIFGITPMEVAASDVKDESVFLKLLDEDTSTGIFWGVKKGANYIISAFFEKPEGKAIGKQRLKAAMARLFTKKAIMVGPHPNKKPSRATDVVQRVRDGSQVHVVVNTAIDPADDDDNGPEEEDNEHTNSEQ
jgi:RecA-family ATPase